MPPITVTMNLGYLVGTAIFLTVLVALVGLQIKAKRFHPYLYWAAFILTRPLGATVGDFLDKPIDHGGLNFSRPVASAVLAVAILLLLLAFPSLAGSHGGQASSAPRP